MYPIFTSLQLTFAFEENLTLSFGLLFLRHIGLFLNFAFSVVLGETLLPKGAYRPWDLFSFLVKKAKHIVNHKSNLGFLRSLSFLFSLYILIIYL